MAKSDDTGSPLRRRTVTSLQFVSSFTSRVGMRFGLAKERLEGKRHMVLFVTWGFDHALGI